MTTETTVGELVAKPIDDQLDRILGQQESTVDDLVALVSEAPQPVDPERPRKTPGETIPVLVTCVGIALVSALIVAFTSWLPQAVVAAVLTMSACFLTYRLCLKLGPAHAEVGERPHGARQVGSRDAELHEASLKELNKIRIFFESLFEKHVFRINEELREGQSEIKRLESRLEEARSDQLRAEQKRAVEHLELSDLKTPDLSALPGRYGELVRIQSGSLRPAQGETRIRELLKTTTNLYRDAAGKKGIKLSSRVAKGVDIMLTDPVMVSRIFEELLDNALAHTGKKGSVSLSATLRESESDQPRLVRINVKDSGSGIGEKDQENLFSPPAPASGTDSEAPSSGLGLPIARGYARLLGGDLHVTSDPKKGTTFTLELPVVT